LFDNYIAKQIKDKLQGQVCQEATSAMNTAGNKALETLPVVIKLDEFLEINYALLEAPKFTSTYIETQHKGEIFLATDPVEAPFSPLPLPPVADTSSKMVYVWITDYVANTAGLVYQKAGKLQYKITPEMISSEFPFQLNTNSFKMLVPQLYSKYPNMPVTLQLKSVKPPTVKVVPGSADLQGVGHVEVYVTNPNTTRAELAFTIGVVLHCDVVPRISFHGTKEVIKANTTFVSAELSLVDTNIGNVSVARLQTAANFLTKAIIIPMLNREYRATCSHLATLLDL